MAQKHERNGTPISDKAVDMFCFIKTAVVSKGFRMQAGSNRLVFKPNAKRATLVGSVAGLGHVVGFEDMGPGLLTDLEAGIGPFAGSDAGPGMGGCLNPLVSPEATSAEVKAFFPV